MKYTCRIVICNYWELSFFSTKIMLKREKCIDLAKASFSIWPNYEWSYNGEKDVEEESYQIEEK